MQTVLEMAEIGVGQVGSVGGRCTVWIATTAGSACKAYDADLPGIPGTRFTDPLTPVFQAAYAASVTTAGLYCASLIVPQRRSARAPQSRRRRGASPHQLQSDTRSGGANAQ